MRVLVYHNLCFFLKILVFDIKTQTVFQVNSPAVSIDGHESVPANDENALMKAAANQPVSVAIDASGIDFQLYSKVVMITIQKSCLHICAWSHNKRGNS